MLLFTKSSHAGLLSGAITVTFRAWDKPRVKVGGRYRCHPIGVLEVDAIDRVCVSDIDESDAKRAGFESREALTTYLRSATGKPIEPTTSLYRVVLHHAGDGDRVSLAMEAPTAEDIAAIRASLARMDREKRWTKRTLALIDANPRVAASQLAKKLGRETLPFKVDVRKLKRLGLTQSFEVGYEISPRGRAYLEATRARSRRRGAAAP